MAASCSSGLGTRFWSNPWKQTRASRADPANVLRNDRRSSAGALVDRNHRRRRWRTSGRGTGWLANREDGLEVHELEQQARLLGDIVELHLALHLVDASRDADENPQRPAIEAQR